MKLIWLCQKLKMKHLIYIIIAVIGLASCSNSKVVVTETSLPEDIFYLDDEIKPYTGKAVIYYSGTNIIKEELTYKDGILNGKATSYYKSGEIKRKGEYYWGRYTGKWVSWYENGNRQYEVEYNNDTLCGNYISWYSTGVIEKKGSYTDNNRTGTWVEYDEAGMIVKKQNYN